MRSDDIDTMPHEFADVDPNQFEMFGHNGAPADDDDTTQAGGAPGFISLYRAIENHWLVGFGKMENPPKQDPRRPNFCRTVAWIDLIMRCHYRDGYVINKGSKMRLERGQLLGAISWLAHRWNWTPKAVRRFLDQLEDDGMITREQPTNTARTNSENTEKPTDVRPKASAARSKRGNLTAVISVCNYDLYQKSHTQQGQARGRQGASKGQHNNKVNKVNKVNNNNLGPSADDVRRAHARWNDLAEKVSLPRSTKLTDALAKQIRARLRDYGPDGWEAALRIVYDTPFLRGGNERGWVPNLTWFCGPQNFAKVIDGGYSKTLTGGTGDMSPEERRTLALYKNAGGHAE